MSDSRKEFEVRDHLLTDLLYDALDPLADESGFSPPDWIDDDFPYQPCEFVGRGGSGFVWKARSRETGEFVALKVVIFQGDVASARERWLREARIAGSLQHPHLMGIHDSGHSPDEVSAWLALEWIDGGDLHQHLEKNGPLEWQTIAPWAEQICQGLDALHQAGLIHRDLKPSNLLLEAQTNRLVVSDFGAALEISEERVTRTTDALLSFGYAAPEQLKIGRLVDGRADQFSLAVTLWELLTAELPVGSFPKLKSRSSKVPFWLDFVLRKALSREPEDRYRDLTHFVSALRPGPHRSRRFLKVAAILLGFGLLVFGFSTLQTEPPAPIIKVQDKTYRSTSVRVKEGVEVYIRFIVTISPDGMVKAIVSTFSTETWRGMKTQGAIALKDSDGRAHLIIVCPNFGVTGEIRPGNGSSRTDYIQARIDPAMALQITDLEFLAHPADDQHNSPWYQKYPEVKKQNANSNLDLVVNDNDNVWRKANGFQMVRELPVVPHDPGPEKK